MFSVGDKIVYPGQGVGVISGIEEKEFKGENQNFYDIEIIGNTMKLKLPANRFKTANIRLLSNSKEIDNSLKHIMDYAEELKDLQKSMKKEREESNKVKVKQGTFEDNLSVVCNLTQLKNCGNANATETQTLSSTRNFVVQEISQAKSISVDEANDLLDGHLDLFPNS